MTKEEMHDTTQYGDPDRRGYMGKAHRSDDAARRADDHEISDGTALPQTDPALAGIEPENPNVNDADEGDSRLVDPGRPNRSER